MGKKKHKLVWIKCEECKWLVSSTSWETADVNLQIHKQAHNEKRHCECS